MTPYFCISKPNPHVTRTSASCPAAWSRGLYMGILEQLHGTFSLWLFIPPSQVPSHLVSEILQNESWRPLCLNQVTSPIHQCHPSSSCPNFILIRQNLPFTLFCRFCTFRYLHLSSLISHPSPPHHPHHFPTTCPAFLYLDLDLLSVSNVAQIRTLVIAK